MEKQVILSGIRATGKMHLGNYVGAIRYFVELATEPKNKCFYFIANLHTLTTHTDPNLLRKSLHGIVLDFLSAGLDPEVATIYAQSSIPEITELTWILSCLTSVNTLISMPHFKEKRESLGKTEMTANAGLLTYPVLMAADILAVKAELVPVGQDQHAHVEMARDTARRFNSQFGELFPLPGFLEGEGIRLPSLAGKGKMGKSEEEGVIYLTDPPEVIETKILKGVTDSRRQHRTDPGEPNDCDIFAYHTLFSDPKEIPAVISGCREASIGCIDCKEIVIKYVNEILVPIRERRKSLEAKGKDFVNDILSDGGRRAGKVIRRTVRNAKNLVGIPKY